MYVTNEELIEKMLKGIEKLVNAIGSTIGPKGKNVILKSLNKKPIVTKDGVTIAKIFQLEDPIENVGVDIIRQSSEQTANVAGDGTSTSALLARSILKESQKYIKSGVPSIDIKRGIEKVIKYVIEELEKRSIPLKTLEDIINIATISANGDEDIGELVSMAIDKSGKDGSILIEESRTSETTLESVEGFRIDSGYLSNAFVTDERKMVVRYDNPLVLITDYKISLVEDLLPILQYVARDGSPFIIIADEIEGAALSALIVNSLNKNMKIAAIKSPRYGEERRNILKDLCLSIGATFITRESGINIRNINLSHLGRVKLIEVSKFFTTLMGGNGDEEKIEERIESLKEQIRQSQSLEECEKIQERITRLASSVSVIYVGGSTEIEMIEKKHRMEDALEAVKSAQEEGIISGGGLELFNISNELNDNLDEFKDMSENEKVGIKIIQQAIREPIKKIVENAGYSGEVICCNVGKNIGFDASSGEYCDLLKKGIIDPMKVTKHALKNAASVSTMIIMSECAFLE